MPKREPTAQRIAREHGMPFPEVLAKLHDEGLTLREAAARLGLKYDTFYWNANRLGDANPWGQEYGLARHLQYTADTGEPFLDAVHRLARTHCPGAAARELGYATGATLQRALASMGVTVQFQTAGRKYTLGGITDTVQGHAKRTGIHWRTLAWRIAQWGECPRVVKEPVAARYDDVNIEHLRELMVLQCQGGSSIQGEQHEQENPQA